ncbi:hypothetical protein DXT99_20285 [Pontibacter diazotrophicus]|uniref:Uncharacterized protein n=1 Tax=Pontibacter diazotrophicus TaxID=1400979 RepID=A0A3D8L7H4_9BACT|nr:hypothetical protein [Pontibacter diazotrophicus]RDV13359.1 hypothetical protein DXT99_20285 [Pontibacter diazotrophicus]
MKKQYLILLLGLLSCRATENSLVGKYDRYWDFEHYSSLELRPNKTFVLTGQEGLSWINTEGAWAVKNKVLTLNSFSNTTTNTPSIVQAERKVAGDSIAIVTFDYEGKAQPGVTVLAYHQSDTVVEDYTKENGKLVFANQPIDSISFRFIGSSPLTYTGESNYFEIRMGFTELPTFRLENKKWRIKGKALLDPRFKGEQKRNKYRKKPNR